MVHFHCCRGVAEFLHQLGIGQELFDQGLQLRIFYPADGCFHFFEHLLRIFFRSWKKIVNIDCARIDDGDIIYNDLQIVLIQLASAFYAHEAGFR